MPMLMDLKLKSCEGINSSSMAALSHCVMLEVGYSECFNWLGFEVFYFSLLIFGNDITYVTFKDY